ncbi:MAG: stage II sporulation protein R [Oscillospiraceae bacterium]|nr:stage II sporulation protein R [Oscillospiraceae bacterium]
MCKFLKRIGLCLMIVCLVWCGTLIADRQRLREELIRLHVVAASDSEEDQAIKLRVRDAVVESLRAEMENLTDAEQAKAYLRENLPKLETLANQVLADAGCGDRASVSLAVEEFGTRVYETFTLPAGVYDALRIVIGEGEGHNWWCVVFPSLCVPATSEGFEDTAAGAGFPDSLTSALEGEEGYEVRFFLLDALGSLENLLHR